MPNSPYKNRESKATYVWQKYRDRLTPGRVLDVGADQGHLKRYLSARGQYWGIGLGGAPDQYVDLEDGSIPFAGNSFDCVLCLDVLEHLDNPHEIFDELCRVTRRHVIISLPNPWGEYFSMLRSREYLPGQPLKYYGLPSEPPEDRHKWFFSLEEAENFIRHRSLKTGMEVLEITNTNPYEPAGLKGFVKQAVMKIIFRDDLEVRNLFSGTLWALLDKVGIREDGETEFS